MLLQGSTLTFSFLAWLSLQMSDCGSASMCYFKFDGQVDKETLLFFSCYLAI